MKKWHELYSTEEELINDMLDTYTNDKKECWRLVKDYRLIRSYKLYYYTNNGLTPDMLARVKHLANEIYDNVHRVKKLKTRNEVVLVMDCPKINKESED
jgi:hypothetical protein